MKSTASTALVPGSLGAVAERDGIGIAESFLSADAIVLVDVSASMSATDSRGGQQRYAAACSELQRLQSDIPGKLAVVAFSGNVMFMPGGVPPFLGGSTDLAGALRFVQVADGTVRFIVVSDGAPDSEDQALAIARKFKSRIDCIHVGPESDRRGVEFLQRLAQQSGGRYVVAEKAAELAAVTKRLMLAGT